MAHAGRCYRNSKYSPAVSEEYAAIEAGRRLILDDDGNYRGDDSAVFLDVIVADNDVRAPSNLIKAQHDIMGDVTDGLAEHIPDIGHVIKDCNNELFHMREKDKSFRGANLLENKRIRAMMADVLTCFQEYKPHIGDDAERTKCLRRINAIVPHHCGKHHRCEWEEVCGYLKIKNNNPTWTETQIQEEYARTGRFGGKVMGLSQHGINAIKKVLFKRFDTKSIDRVARCLSSNSAEGFFGGTSKFSGGKRLCLEHTDLWRSMLLLGFCRAGNIERTHQELMTILNLELLDPDRKHLAVWKKKREKDYVRNNCEEAKERRHATNALKDQILMKEDSKKRHRNAKVNVKESAAVGSATKKRRVVTCGKCKQPGHNRSNCPLPEVPKPLPNVDLVDWHQDTPSNCRKGRGKQYQPDLIDWG